MVDSENRPETGLMQAWERDVLRLADEYATVHARAWKDAEDWSQAEQYGAQASAELAARRYGQTKEDEQAAMCALLSRVRSRPPWRV